MAATLFINAHLLDPDQGLDEIGQLGFHVGGGFLSAGG
ncbi:hypothetical protein ACVWZJ_000400 [Thermostichus sp. OS-CIW-29]